MLRLPVLPVMPLMPPRPGLPPRAPSTGVAGYGAVVPARAGTAPGPSPVSTSGPPTSADVVVVGAGLAGLACARELMGSGLDVVVLEAGDGVGGRVRTDEVDGVLVDRGFQLLNPTYPALPWFVDVDALRLQPLGAGVVVARGPAPDRTLLADPFRRPDALPGMLRSGLLDAGDLLGLARLAGRAVLTPVARLERAPDTGWHAAFDAAGLTGPLRRHVVEPFLTGTLADADGTTSRRYVDLLLRSFVKAGLLGSPGLPVGGMQAFSNAVAAPLPTGSVRTGARVESLTATGDSWTVHGSHPDGEFQLLAGTVVLAGHAAATAGLLERPLPEERALTTVWHLSEEPLGLRGRGRYLHVDGDRSHTRRHGLVNTVVVSRSAPDYLPPALVGHRDLVATTVLGTLDGRGRSATDVRDQAARVLGTSPTTLGEEVAVQEIPHALPRTPLPLDVRRPVDLTDGRFVVGDHRDSPSIQGALVSGRRGARAVLAHLGLRPATGTPAETPTGDTTREDSSAR